MNRDEKFDTWEIYGDEGLARMEKDEDGNGQADLVGYYTGGKLVKCIKDSNGDGHFEITQCLIDRSGPWSWNWIPILTEILKCETMVKGSTTRIKEMDDNSDGTVDKREISGENEDTRIEIDENSVGK